MENRKIARIIDRKWRRKWNMNHNSLGIYASLLRKLDSDHPAALIVYQSVEILLTITEEICS